MKTLLIIGASRGLGLALADEHLRRGWHVIATQRSDKASGLAALSKRYKESLEIEAVDINDPASLVALREKLAGRQIDLLFVNAGVTNDPHETVGEVTTDEFTRIMITNALSPMRAIEILQELVPVTGLIAVMSSGLGSVADNESGGLGGLSRQQSGAQYFHAQLCCATCERSARLSNCGPRLGTHRHGRARSNLGNRGEHPSNSGFVGAQRR